MLSHSSVAHKVDDFVADNETISMADHDDAENAKG